MFFKYDRNFKEKYKKQIIVAITIKDKSDVIKYMEFNEIADIILFDSKGYEKSLSFDHQLIKNLKIDSSPTKLLVMIILNIIMK